MQIQKQAGSFLIMIILFWFPTIATAEEYVWTNNGDGTCTITDYTGPGGDITLPDTLGGLTVTAIGDSAFRYNFDLTGITLSENILAIEDSAFYYCAYLTSVTLNDRLTTIGDSAFCYCTRLPQITLSQHVSTIERWAFRECRALSAIDVDPLNSSFSSSEGVLFDKTQTTLYRYPLAKPGEYQIPESATSLHYEAFQDCTSLTGVTIPAGVSYIGWCFRGCEELTEIEVDPQNSAYSSIDGVLFDKDQSELLWYPAAKSGEFYAVPDGVTYIGGNSFEDCRHLVRLVTPDTVEEISRWAFSKCSNLTEVSLSDQLAILQQETFFYCSNLRRVIIGNGLTDLESMCFHYCDNLTALYFKGDAPVPADDALTDLSDTTVYYRPDTTGWGPTFEGLATAVWPPEINLQEMALLASFWQMNGCEESQPCSDVDWFMDGTIDLLDLQQLAVSWLGYEVVIDDPIGRHIDEIEMSLSADFGEGYAAAEPVGYQFDAWMRIDDTITGGSLRTPTGAVYLAVIQTEEDGRWAGIYEVGDSLHDLADFTVGNYIFTVFYADGTSQSTEVPFTLEDGSPIPPVEQRLVVNYPEHNAAGIPLTLYVQWNPLNNPDWTYSLEWFDRSGRPESLSGSIDDLPFDTASVGPLSLSPDTSYEIELTVNHAIRSINSDGIPFVVDKDSEVEIHFTTVSTSN